MYLFIFLCGGNVRLITIAGLVLVALVVVVVLMLLVMVA